MTRNQIALLAAIICISVSVPSVLSVGPSLRSAGAQEPSHRATVIGEVTSIDVNSRVAIVKTDAGDSITVSFGDNARFLKIQAGDVSLTRASETALADISVGDRVSSRGLPGADKKQLSAETVVVMSRADIQKKQEQDNKEWATHSIAGIVRELKPETAEVVVESYGPAGPARVVVQTTGCKFRRYSLESVRFSDTRPSALADLKVGDQLRALGENSANGTAWKASEIVSGSFQTFGGIVTSIDPHRSEIKISLLGQKREAVVEITTASTLKRISPQAAMIIAQRALGLRQGPQPAAAGGQKAPAAPTQKGPNPPTAPQLPDSQQIIDGLPDIPLSGIKAGDVVAVTSAGGDISRVAAIKLVAGVDVVINAINGRAGQHQMVALSAGLPLGIFDYGVSQR